MLPYDAIQLPGNILWTGVAMLTSWRCFSVSVWNSRRVDPDVKAIHTPTPATAMWEITIPSSWWASKWLCKKNKGSVGRCKSRISLNLSYQPFSVGTVSSSSLTRTKLPLPCSGYVLIATYNALISLWFFFMEGFSALEPKSHLMTVTQIFWFLKILHDRGWQAPKQFRLKRILYFFIYIPLGKLPQLYFYLQQNFYFNNKKILCFCSAMGSFYSKNNKI